jgi:hypothetical protein
MEERFQEHLFKNDLGPGQYPVLGSITTPVSNLHFRNTRGHSFFTKEKRSEFPKNLNPGPGSYRTPTEFGYIELHSKIASDHSQIDSLL